MKNIQSYGGRKGKTGNTGPLGVPPPHSYLSRIPMQGRIRNLLVQHIFHVANSAQVQDRPVRLDLPESGTTGKTMVSTYLAMNFKNSIQSL